MLAPVPPAPGAPEPANLAAILSGSAGNGQCPTRRVCPSWRVTSLPRAPMPPLASGLCKLRGASKSSMNMGTYPSNLCVPQCSLSGPVPARGGGVTLISHQASASATGGRMAQHQLITYGIGWGFSPEVLQQALQIMAAQRGGKSSPRSRACQHQDWAAFFADLQPEDLTVMQDGSAYLDFCNLVQHGPRAGACRQNVRRAQCPDV